MRTKQLRRVLRLGSCKPRSLPLRGRQLRGLHLRGKSCKASLHSPTQSRCCRGSKQARQEAIATGAGISCRIRGGEIVGFLLSWMGFTTFQIRVKTAASHHGLLA